MLVSHHQVEELVRQGADLFARDDRHHAEVFAEGIADDGPREIEAVELLGGAFHRVNIGNHVDGDKVRR